MKTIIYLILIIGAMLFIFRDEVFDKKLTPEERQAGVNQANKIMLDVIEKSEEKDEEKSLSDQKVRDCEKDAIAKGESINTYIYRCNREANK